MRNFLAAPFPTVAGQIKARLATLGGSVNYITEPDAKKGLYLAQPGFYLRFFPPQPVDAPAGGVYHLRTVRPFVVYIVTQSLLDPPGADDAALTAHWVVEDAVVNALIDKRQQTVKIGEGRGVHWTPGGADAARTVKIDNGVLFSALSFAVEYPAPCSA